MLEKARGKKKEQHDRCRHIAAYTARRHGPAQQAALSGASIKAGVTEVLSREECGHKARLPRRNRRSAALELGLLGCLDAAGLQLQQAGEALGDGRVMVCCVQ